MQPKFYLIAAAVGTAFGLAAYSWLGWRKGAPDIISAGPRVAPGAITANQIERLGIRTTPAEAAADVPLGTVPAVISLPPEAQVAVTAPFDGAVIRLFVVQGQAVTKGQALAVIKSREPVQYGAELARANARLGLAEVSAARTRQLVDEGVVAASRADEMNAQIRVARTDVSENARILALAGAGANGNVTLRAPISGRVATVNVQAGGPVGGTTAPFVIENSAALMLDLQLPERLANSVAPGMTVVLQSFGTEARNSRNDPVGRRFNGSDDPLDSGKGADRCCPIFSSGQVGDGHHKGDRQPVGNERSCVGADPDSGEGICFCSFRQPL